MPIPIEIPTAERNKSRGFLVQRSRCWFGTVFVLLLIIGNSGCGSGTVASPPSETENSLKHDSSNEDSLIEGQSIGQRSIQRSAANGENSPGTKPKDRYLIIHADDAGLCRSVNRATIEAMERGVVSSASIMVPAPSFEEFAEYAREHPERDFGIHLTLNAEFRTHRWGPVLPAREVPSLVDSEGYLWQTERQTAARARADDVERELTAQIERARKFGVPISHLDTHMGTCFTRADFVEIYVNLGIKYSLPVLATRDKRVLRQFPIPPDVIQGIDGVIQRLEEERFPILDSLSMYYGGGIGRQRRNHYFNVFQKLPVGVSELIVHCGYADRDLLSVTGMASIREGDRQVMTDPETSRELSRLKIKVIDWKEFRKIAGGEPQENDTENADATER